MAKIKKQAEMKQHKDEDILYYTIKIRRVREVSGCQYDREYKDKSWYVDCRDFAGHGIAFCEPTLKKAFNTLMGELWLKK